MPVFPINTDPEGKPLIALKKCSVRLVEPRILENYVKEGSCIDVEDIFELKKANEFLCPGEKYAVLVESSNFNSITAEARRLTASESFIKNTLGKALMVYNPATKMVAEFYLRVNKPKMPTKVFSDRASAMKWLREIAGTS